MIGRDAANDSGRDDNVLEELFADGRYDIPIRIKASQDTDVDWKHGVNKQLTSYINDLERLDVNPSIVQRVKRFRRSCAHTLTNYFKGNHYLAFENFTKAVSSLQIDGSKLLVTPLGNEPLFRARVNKTSDDFDEDGMFHIGLNNRSLVDSQRYSFPGLPCLYLASSAYTCWMELGRPSFDTFQVAMFTPKDTAASVIDLSRVPQQLDHIRHEPWFAEEEYLAYWPLVAMCSIRVEREQDPFKPEYVFPQFFLEYIRQNGSEHVGVKYASLKCEKQFQSDWHSFTNYVFPSTSGDTHGKRDGRLDSLFEVTSNRSGSELQLLTSVIQSELRRTKTGPAATELDGLVGRLRTRTLLTGDNATYKYVTSPLGLIELALACSDFDYEAEQDRIVFMTDEEIDDAVAKAFEN